MLARIPEGDLRALLEGYGYTPHFVSGFEPEELHQQMAATLDEVVGEIRAVQRRAREHGDRTLPRWPMIVLRTTKGWTGPEQVDGIQVEGTFRSHQVPLAGLAERPEHLAALEAWMRSYRPEELFDEAGGLRSDLAALAPVGERRMGANPHANGGLLTRPLELPDFRDNAIEVPDPGATTAEATRVLGAFLRDVIARNPATFRLMGPDETVSNRRDAVFETTDRAWDADRLDGDDHLAPDGRVMEVLSEHLCEGWLEGYLLTGRHGLFNCYEAFIHIVDSMFNQARQVAGGDEQDPVAGGDPLAELPALVARLAAGPQRVLPPRPRLHRSRGQQEGGGGPRLPAARCQLPALGGRPLPAQPQLRQRDRRREAARAAVALDGRRDRALRPWPRHLGMGEQ